MVWLCGAPGPKLATARPSSPGSQAALLSSVFGRQRIRNEEVAVLGGRSFPITHDTASDPKPGVARRFVANCPLVAPNRPIQ